MNKKAFLLTCLVFTTSIIAHDNYDESFSRHLMRKILNGVFYLITNEADHPDYTFTENLMKEIDPTIKLMEVRKFNRLGQMIFGHHNTIALPFANYVVINSKTLNTLSAEARRFVIGRSLLTLNEPMKYIGYKYVLPGLGYLISEACISKEDKEFATALLQPEIIGNLTQCYNVDIKDHLESTVKVPWKAHLLRTCSKIVTAYWSRSLERQLDHEAATTFNAAAGGREFLESHEKFEQYMADGYGWDSSRNQYYAIIQTDGITETRLYGDVAALHQFLFPNDFYLLGIASWFYRFASGVESHRGNDQLKPYIKYAKWFERIRYGIKNQLPGQNTPFSNKISHFIYSLPLMSWFNHFPTTSSRIEALKKLSEKGSPETK